MKKFLLLISSVLLTFGANAQVSKFEGASATVALAYQSYSTDVASLVTRNGGLTAPNSASKGLVGKIGLDYTWSLGNDNFLAVGLDYALNEGGRGVFDYQLQGVSVDTEGVKIKQKAKIFIAPSTLINQDTLGYIKLGYAQYQSKYMSDNSKLTASAITYGIGAKFMSSEKSYFFVEANVLSGRSKTETFENATMTSKPKGSEVLVGYGIKF